MYQKFIGKKVLVRSYDAGVYFGTLVEAEGECCEMKDVRNIWSWQGASCLSQIANDGIASGKVSPIVGDMVLNRCCQVILLTDKAIMNLENQKIWEF